MTEGAITLTVAGIRAEGTDAGRVFFKDVLRHRLFFWAASRDFSFAVEGIDGIFCDLLFLCAEGIDAVTTDKNDMVYSYRV